MIHLRVQPAVYVSLTILLLAGSYMVFRILVRRDYLRRGSLSGLTSALQMAVFAGVFGYPNLFSPPEWSLFWNMAGPTGRGLQAAGLITILLGFLTAFGTMGWFGLRRAFGLDVPGLVRGGPYGWTRNPQVLGGYLLVLGTVLQWPSWFSCGWLAIYGLTGHWMILTEEEHLKMIFGEEYEQFCREVPRYLW